MTKQEYLGIVAKMFAAGVKDAGGKPNAPSQSAIGAYFYAYGNTMAGVSISVNRVLQVAGAGWDVGASHSTEVVPQDLVGDKYLSTLWAEAVQMGAQSGSTVTPPPKTSSNLWWKMSEMTAELASMNSKWMVYAQQLLSAAVDAAKSSAVTLASFRNATNSPNANTGTLLSTGLDTQAATLFTMAEQINAMITGVQMKGSTSLLLALAKYTVKAHRYYVDQNRANTIRSKDETFYPFLIVNDSAYWPTTIPTGPVPTAVQFNLVLMDAKGQLVLVVQDSSETNGYRYVAAVHPQAFVQESGIAPPWGIDLPTIGIPRDDKGVMVVTTEDAVHQVIGKLLDFAMTVWSQLALEMQAYAAKNPGASLPTLPVPPPTVADVNVQLPPPTPGTGGTKIGLIEPPAPPSTPETPPTGLHPGPSLWKIAGAILLAGGAAYGAWKITHMITDKEPRRRTVLNPSVRR